MHDAEPARPGRTCRHGEPEHHRYGSVGEPAGSRQHFGVAGHLDAGGMQRRLVQRAGDDAAGEPLADQPGGSLDRGGGARPAGGTDHAGRDSWGDRDLLGNWACTTAPRGDHQQPVGA